jgi:hypothetical protein
MAAGLVEKMMTLWVRSRLRWSWARQIAETNAPRSVLNAVAVMPRFRVVWANLVPWRKATAVEEAGCCSSSLSRLALEPRERTVRWSKVLVLVWMVFATVFRSSSCLTWWMEAKSSAQGARRGRRCRECWERGGWIGKRVAVGG